MKKSRPYNDIASLSSTPSWSISSGQLSPKGEAELFRFFGSVMRDGYQHIIEAEMPDRLKALLAKLDAGEETGIKPPDTRYP